MVSTHIEFSNSSHIEKSTSDVHLVFFTCLSLLYCFLIFVILAFNVKHREVKNVHVVCSLASSIGATLLVSFPFVWTKHYQEWYCKGGIITFIGIGSSLYMIPLAIKSWILMKISQMTDTGVTDAPAPLSNATTTAPGVVPTVFSTHQGNRSTFSPRNTLRQSLTTTKMLAVAFSPSSSHNFTSQSLLATAAPLEFQTKQKEQKEQEKEPSLFLHAKKFQLLKCSQQKVLLALLLLMIFPVAIIVVNIHSVIMKEEKISFFETLQAQEQQVDIFLESVCSSNLLEWKYAWMSFCLFFWFVWASFLVRCNEKTHPSLDQVRQLKLCLSFIISICALLLLNDFFMTRIRKVLSEAVPSLLIKVYNITETHASYDTLMQLSWSLFRLEEFSYFARSYILIVGLPICQTLLYSRVLYVCLKSNWQSIYTRFCVKLDEKNSNESEMAPETDKSKDKESSPAVETSAILLPHSPTPHPKRAFSSRMFVQHRRIPSIPSDVRRNHSLCPGDLNPARANYSEPPKIEEKEEKKEEIRVDLEEQKPVPSLEEEKQSSSSKHRRMVVQLSKLSFSSPSSPSNPSSSSDSIDEEERDRETKKIEVEVEPVSV